MSGSRSEYAKEELVAELASVLICYRIRVGFDLQNHASYLKSWSSILKEGGSKVLFQVLSEARKAADLIAPEVE
jgi:antirestriction protein ArdC